MNTNEITRVKEKLGEKEYRLKQIREQIESLQKEKSTVKKSCSQLREKLKYLQSAHTPEERKRFEREQLVPKVIELISNSPDGISLEELSNKLLKSQVAVCAALKDARDRGFEYVKIQRRTYYGKRTIFTTNKRLDETLKNKIISMIYAGPMRTQELAERLNLVASTIQPIIDELVDSGQLKSISQNHRQAKIYSLNKNYQEAC